MTLTYCKDLLTVSAWNDAHTKHQERILGLATIYKRNGGVAHALPGQSTRALETG